MAVAQQHYGSQDTLLRARALYQEKIGPLIEAEHRGEYIAIDIQTGEYEIGKDYDAAADVLFARDLDAAICILRIGYRTAGRA